MCLVCTSLAVLLLRPRPMVVCLEWLSGSWPSVLQREPCCFPGIRLYNGVSVRCSPASCKKRLNVGFIRSIDVSPLRANQRLRMRSTTEFHVSGHKGYWHRNINLSNIVSCEPTGRALDSPADLQGGDDLVWLSLQFLATYSCCSYETPGTLRTWDPSDCSCSWSRDFWAQNRCNCKSWFC